MNDQFQINKDGLITEYKITFKMDIEQYFSHMLDVIAIKKKDFLINNQMPPEVIFIDWETYKKIEIANMSKRYPLKVTNYNQVTAYGLEFIVLPINTYLLELGYKSNGKNVDLGIMNDPKVKSNDIKRPAWLKDGWEDRYLNKKEKK